MSGLKVAGGIVALIGSVLVLLSVILGYLGVISLFQSVFAAVPINGIINLILALVALVGAILGMKGKRSGGALALAIGIVFILMGILMLMFEVTNPILALTFMPASLFVGLIGIGLGPATFEAIMILVGGILILAGGKD